MNIKHLNKIFVVFSLCFLTLFLTLSVSATYNESPAERLISDQQEIIDELGDPVKLITPLNESLITKGVSFKDGRLVFTSSAALQSKVDYFKTLDRNTLSNAMYTFYNQGFKPLVPIYKDTDSLRQDSYEIRKVRALSGIRLSVEQILLEATDEDFNNTDYDKIKDRHLFLAV